MPLIFQTFQKIYHPCRQFISGMTDEESACRLEALVTVDERGQMVLPKDLRERLGLGPGDRLAISSCECAGEVCCLVLMRADRLDGMVRGVLGPVMREVL